MIIHVLLCFFILFTLENPQLINNQISLFKAWVFLILKPKSFLYGTLLVKTQCFHGDLDDSAVGK